MTTQALIADDEANLAEYLKARLQVLWPELDILPLAANGLAALRAIGDEEPDIAFLDIRMPGLTGLEVAGRAGAGTHVVFVTAYDQYAAEAYDRAAVDYLLKPVTDERLAKCIERLKRKLEGDEPAPGLDEVLAHLSRALPGAGGAGKLRWVRALKGEVVHQIAVDDVLYFQASDKYTCVITREGEALIRLPLAELAGQLDADVFWQVHRSTIVNMNAVASTRRDLGGRTFVTLKDGHTELAVSRAYAHLFKQM